jgi:hypothetical protein
MNPTVLVLQYFYGSVTDINAIKPAALVGHMKCEQRRQQERSWEQRRKEARNGRATG